MNTFNFKRFANTLTWQIISRRKIYYKAAGTGLLAILVCFFLNLVSNNSNAGYPSTIGSLFVFVLAGYLLTGSALIVSNLNDKHSRINTFMLPASKLEKFVSRYICIIVVLPLAALAGLAAGDVLQLIVNQLVFHNSSSVLATFFSSFGSLNFVPIAFPKSAFTNFTGYLLINSVYLLFGSFFRKHAWIKSNLLLITIFTVLTIATMLGVAAILNSLYGEGNWSIVLIDGIWAEITTYAIAYAVICFNFWASFRLYSRLQAVNNKWYNL